MTQIFDFIALAASMLFPAPVAVAPAPETVSMDVAGEKRSFIVVAPEKPAAPAPLVIAFHGKGGTGRQHRLKWQIDQQWPQALVIYPNGLRRSAPLYDPKGEKSGWSVDASDENPDIKFFDSILVWARKHHKVDSRRVLVTGHSNGGFFTYVLGSKRGSALAGIAPSSATGARFVAQLPEIPVFHLAGQQDALVSYRMQNMTIDSLLSKRSLGAQSESPLGVVTYGRGAKRVVTFVHAGGHAPPKEGTAALVSFLKGC